MSDTQRREICGASCPTHVGKGSRCAAVCSDGAGIFGDEKDLLERVLGHSPTLQEHRAGGGPHLCIAGHDGPHAWRKRRARNVEKGESEVRAVSTPPSGGIVSPARAIGAESPNLVTEW